MNNAVNYIEKIKRNTAFKDDKRAAAVVQTLHWLENGAPHAISLTKQFVHFDMHEFMSNEVNPRNDYNNKDFPTCGTACCIAGAIHMFENPEILSISDFDQGIDDIFDLNDDNLSWLFYDTSIAFSEITPKGAAKTLRRYIDTGLVTWKIEEQVK